MKEDRKSHSKYKTGDITGRACAYLIDGYFIPFFLTLLSCAIIITITNYLTGIIFFFLMFILPFVYFLVKDSIFKNGQSIGKMVFRKRVIDYKSKKPCTVMQSIIRNIPMVIPFIPLIELIKLTINSENRRFGDKWANTIVVEEQGKGGKVICILLILLAFLSGIFIIYINNFIVSYENNLKACENTSLYIPSGYLEWNNGMIKATVKVSGTSLGNFMFVVTLNNKTTINLKDTTSTTIFPDQTATIISESIRYQKNDIFTVQITTNCTNVKSSELGLFYIR